MSIHIHDAPSSLQRAPESLSAPSLMDWAVVAKVMKLGSARAIRVGIQVMDTLASHGPDSYEQLLAVDLNPDESVATFTYSLPDYHGHQDSAIKSALFDGISYTRDALEAVAPAGLIVGVRLARWRDLQVAGQDGEAGFDTSWDKLSHTQDQLAENLLEASGHGLHTLNWIRTS